MYTFAAKSGKVSEQNSAFADYSIFLNEAVLFYQCTGSNNLLYTLNSEYIKSVSLEHKYQAQRIQGYVKPFGANEVKAYNGHLHNLVTNLTRHFAYQELDGTPYKMDPRFQWLSEEHPTAPQPHEKVPVEPNYPGIFRTEALKLIKDNPRTNSGGETKKSALKKLNKMRDALSKLIIMKTGIYPQVQDYQNYGQYPGLNFLAYTKLLSDIIERPKDYEFSFQSLMTFHFSKKLDYKPSEEFLKKIRQKINDLEDQDISAYEFIGSVFNELNSKYNGIVNKARLAKAQDQSVPLPYLLDEELSPAFDDFIVFLAKTDWEEEVLATEEVSESNFGEHNCYEVLTK